MEDSKPDGQDGFKSSIADELANIIRDKKEEDDKKEKSDKEPARKSLWEWLGGKVALLKPVGESEAEDKPKWFETTEPPENDDEPEAPADIEPSAVSPLAARDSEVTISHEPEPIPEAPETPPIISPERTEASTPEPASSETVAALETPSASSESAPVAEPAIDTPVLPAAEAPPIAPTVMEQAAIEQSRQTDETPEPTAEQPTSYGYDRRAFRRELDRQSRELEYELRRDKRQAKQELRQNRQNLQRDLLTTPEQSGLVAETQLSAEKPTERIVERPNTVAAQEHVEQTPSTPLWAEALKTQTERLTQPPIETLTSQKIEATEARPTPEIIQKQVMEAAEHNQPIERKIEQSHEIKDLDRQKSAVPIAAVMDEARRRYGQLPDDSQAHLPSSSVTPPIVPPAKPPTEELYAAAMRWGFWAAAALIVLGLIAYLALK